MEENRPSRNAPLSPKAARQNSTKKEESPVSSSPNSNFPVRLHCLIEEAEKDGLDHIISWQSHGRCFIVHKPKAFVEQLLPLWFSQKKFQSFQRQLNIYGFLRVQIGRDKGCYYHELFLRGQPLLAHGIKRRSRSSDGNSSVRSSDASTIEYPLNFYDLPPLPSLASSSRKESTAVSETTSATSSTTHARETRRGACDTACPSSAAIGGQITSRLPFSLLPRNLDLLRQGLLGMPVHQGHGGYISLTGAPVGNHSLTIQQERMMALSALLTSYPTIPHFPGNASVASPSFIPDAKIAFPSTASFQAENPVHAMAKALQSCGLLRNTNGGTKL